MTEPHFDRKPPSQATLDAMQKATEGAVDRAESWWNSFEWWVMSEIRRKTDPLAIVHAAQSIGTRQIAAAIVPRFEPGADDELVELMVSQFRTLLAEALAETRETN